MKKFLFSLCLLVCATNQVFAAMVNGADQSEQQQAGQTGQDMKTTITVAELCDAHDKVVQDLRDRIEQIEDRSDVDEITQALQLRLKEIEFRLNKLGGSSKQYMRQQRARFEKKDDNSVLNVTLGLTATFALIALALASYDQVNGFHKPSFTCACNNVDILVAKAKALVGKT